MTKKKADIGGKRLISLAPEQWVRWLTNNPDLTVKEIISPLENGNLLNHLEFERRYQLILMLQSYEQKNSFF
jgi:hypothetical protein